MEIITNRTHEMNHLLHILSFYRAVLASMSSIIFFHFCKPSTFPFRPRFQYFVRPVFLPLFGLEQVAFWMPSQLYTFALSGVTWLIHVLLLLLLLSYWLHFQPFVAVGAEDLKAGIVCKVWEWFSRSKDKDPNVVPVLNSSPDFI